MRHPALTLRQTFWMVCACVLLLPHFAAAEPSLAIDFDAGGRRDRVMMDRLEPSVLHAWRSASDATQVVRTWLPLLQVVAIDLDGDHQPELTARDSEWQIPVEGSTACALYGARAWLSLTGVAPFAPRPPPALVPAVPAVR